MIEMKIGASEAKRRFPELLQRVKAGARFTITSRGKAIADLVPSRAAVSKAVAVARFRAFMRRNPVSRRVEIKKLIEKDRGVNFVLDEI